MCFFFQAEDGIRDDLVTGVQTCALPIYELDRVGGRYRGIDKERAAARTLYALGREKPVDLFDLRKRYTFLEPFLDAEYGSAAFVPVNQPAEPGLRGFTTGPLFLPSTTS